MNPTTGLSRGEDPGFSVPATPHFSLVIPAYNEARRIGHTLEKTIGYLQKQSFDWEILVVDDGSADTTSMAAGEISRDENRVSVIRLEENRGKGHALKTGVLRARGCLVGFMDADYKTEISCASLALHRLQSGWDVAIGSRRIRGSRIGVKPRSHRRMGSVLFNQYLHGILPDLGRFKDTQCGFKFFTRRAAREIFQRQVIERFMFDAEVLFLALRLGFRVCEFPVKWSSDHDTRTRMVESILRNTCDLLRIRKTHRKVQALTSPQPENAQC